MFSIVECIKILSQRVRLLTEDDRYCPKNIVQPPTGQCCYGFSSTSWLKGDTKNYIFMLAWWQRVVQISFVWFSSCVRFFSVKICAYIFSRMCPIIDQRTKDDKHGSKKVRIFSDILEQENDYSGTLDFRRGRWGWSLFSFLRSPITNPQYIQCAA